MASTVSGCRVWGSAWSRARGRQGIALLAVVLVGVAITLVAHAALLLGRTVLISARSEAARVEASAALGLRLVSAFHTIESSRDLRTPLPSGISGHLLTEELLHLSADSAGQLQEVIAWRPSPASRLRDDSVGVRTGSAADAATRSRIEALSAAADPCPAGVTVTAALRDDRPVVGWAGEDPLRFGPLPAAATAATFGSPPPVPPPAPVGTFVSTGVRPAVGRWEGAYWYDGDLDVGPGVEIAGRVAVSGDLTIEGGGVVAGIVRVGGRLRIDPGGRLRVAPCLAFARMAAVRWPVFPVRPLGNRD